MELGPKEFLLIVLVVYLNWVGHRSLENPCFLASIAFLLVIARLKVKVFRKPCIFRFKNSDLSNSHRQRMILQNLLFQTMTSEGNNKTRL